MESLARPQSFGSGHEACLKKPHCFSAAGEEPATGIIASITNGSPSLVTCVDDERLELEVPDTRIRHICIVLLIHAAGLEARLRML